MAFAKPMGTAQQGAWSFIRERILTGVFPGGLRLNPQRIADDLGISRMPVREALLQLDAEGLVTIRPNRGAVVTILTADDVQELFEMRAVLEGLALRLAASRIRGPLTADLDDLRTRMDRVRSEPRLWTQRHDEFHDFIARQSGRPRLLTELQRIRAAVRPYLLLYIDVYHNTEMIGFEHDAIVDAIVSGDDQHLEACMRDHVMSAANGVLEFLRSDRGRSAHERVRKRIATSGA
jgi:DNA-binding GntR family transcriptional regulator